MKSNFWKLVAFVGLGILALQFFFSLSQKFILGRFSCGLEFDSLYDEALTSRTPGLCSHMTKLPVWRYVSDAYINPFHMNILHTSCRALGKYILPIDDSYNTVSISTCLSSLAVAAKDPTFCYPIGGVNPYDIEERQAKCLEPYVTLTKDVRACGEISAPYRSICLGLTAPTSLPTPMRE